MDLRYMKQHNSTFAQNLDLIKFWNYEIPKWRMALDDKEMRPSLSSFLLDCKKHDLVSWELVTEPAQF